MSIPGDLADASSPELDAATEHALRPLLLAIAYRMVGSRTDAEDLVQEALLRTVVAQRRERIDSLEAYATTVLTRLAIDHLRSARVRRETYVGPWLPEPVSADPAGDGARAAELADSLSLAFLVALESLAPVERAALLLHDVFGYGYPELARMLDRTEAACRQQVSRARAHLRERRPRYDVDPALHDRLLREFLAACTRGDLDGIVSTLTDDAVLLTDGGPNARAARFPIRGPIRIARLMAKVFEKRLRMAEVRRTHVNGTPGFAFVLPDGRVWSAGSLDVADGRIREVHWVINPEKLQWVQPS